jgi:hypothetical protein
MVFSLRRAHTDSAPVRLTAGAEPDVNSQRKSYRGDAPLLVNVACSSWEAVHARLIIQARNVRILDEPSLSASVSFL